MPSGVLNQLKSRVMTGFLSLPRRGAEVGGVLLGRVTGHRPLAVEITGFEPVACEYRFGPTFTLSDKDLAGLDRNLAELAARRDAAIVGYFRSCTGRELALDQADQDLMRTRFSGPEMIVLSIKPLSISKSVAWFFFRRDGVLPTGPAHPPFAFDDRQDPETPRPAPIEAPVALSLLPTPQLEPEPEPVHAPVAASPRPVWHWAAAACGVLALVIAGYRYAGSPAPPAAQPVQTVIAQPRTPIELPTLAPAEPPAKPPTSTVPAVAIQQAEPEVPEGIRARIVSPIRVDVKVAISPDGSVTRAKAAGNGDSIFRFLAQRAIEAARSSTFEPAHTGDGTPVASTAVLSFVFEPPPASAAR